MEKPKLNHRATTWRPTPADDQAARIIADYLNAKLGQNAGQSDAIRFSLRYVAEVLAPVPQAGTESSAA